jgi:hypothetical protein
MGTAPSFKSFILVLFVGFVNQGCVSEVDVSMDELNEVSVQEEDTIITTTPGATVVLDHEEHTTPPSIVDFTTTCSCGWETWRRQGGLICSGLRCNEYCDERSSACIEHYTCFPSGI